MFSKVATKVNTNMAHFVTGCETIPLNVLLFAISAELTLIALTLLALVIK